MKKLSVPPMDRFFYIIACILSCGLVYLLKIIILNALIERDQIFDEYTDAKRQAILDNAMTK